MMSRARRRSANSNVNGWKTVLASMIPPLGTGMASHASSSSSTELSASNLRQVSLPFVA